MKKHVSSITWLWAALGLLFLSGPAVADVSPHAGGSASINAVATVLEPVGLIATAPPTPWPSAIESSASGFLLRLPPRQTVLIRLTAPNISDHTISALEPLQTVQHLDANLVRQYRGGTITVVFPGD